MVINMATKRLMATMWKKEGDEGLNLTLDIPIYFSGGKAIAVKKVELPELMTSNQFNKFIRSDKGKEWAKQEFIKENPEWAKATFNMNKKVMFEGQELS